MAPAPKSAAYSTPPIAQRDIFSLPVSADLQKLTKSERLFSIATEVDIRSLTISTDIEFRLFVDMRAEKQWASYRMTSHRWVSETREYNQRLKAKNDGEKQLTIFKNPRALLDKLASIEADVMKRLATGNFTCEYQ